MEASVDAFIMAELLYVGFGTWFPPVGRPSTELCYVGVVQVVASLLPGWLTLPGQEERNKIDFLPICPSRTQARTKNQEQAKIKEPQKNVMVAK